MINEMQQDVAALTGAAFALLLVALLFWLVPAPWALMLLGVGLAAGFAVLVMKFKEGGQ